MKRHTRGKVAVGAHGREVITPTKRCECGGLNEFDQFALLHGIGMIYETRLILQTVAHMSFDERCKVHFFIVGFVPNG